MDDLLKTGKIAAAGMKAQATRLRVVSENMANADSVAKTPGGEPYRRKIITFKNTLDRALDANVVRVDRVSADRTEFGRRHEPNHPAADADGYVLLPNVNPLVEMMDMREAQRTYEANLGVVNVTKDMVKRTVELLR
ncbi:MAG: flagellar basal body rod protein FlgC [Alphaproteobacteria bacterium]